MHGLRCALMISLVVLLVAATPVAPQVTCASMDECPATTFSRTGLEHELATAGANAVLGGVTAAVGRLLRGEPVWDAVWQGALGGGLAYAGKRVAVERFYGAGLLGRQLASVGGSVVRSAGMGHGPLHELVLPVGPVRLYVSGDGVTPRLDLATVIASGAFMVAFDARLDLSASLSAGALVFRGDSPMPGLTSAGATVVWSDMPAAEGPRLMAHERVHILQYDQLFLAWGERLERWAVERAPGRVGAAGLFDHIDLGVSALGIRTGLAMVLDYRTRPWETEAYLLSQRVYPAGRVPTGDL